MTDDPSRPDRSGLAKLMRDGVLSEDDLNYFMRGLVSSGTPDTSAETPPVFTWKFSTSDDVLDGK